MNLKEQADKITFKEKRGDVFVFDSGYNDEELTLTEINDNGKTCYGTDNVIITKDYEVIFQFIPEIGLPKAFALMRILNDEGLA